MKKRDFLLLAAVCGTLLGAGCASQPEAQPAAPTPVFPASSVEAGQAAAAAYVDAVASSLRSGKFEAWHNAIPAESRDKITEEMFQRMLKLLEPYGQLVKVEYLGDLDQTEVRDYLWKFTFEKTIKEGQPVRRRQLIHQVRMFYRDGKLGFAGSGFRRI